MDWQIVEHFSPIGAVPMQQHPNYARACAALGAPSQIWVYGDAAHPVATAQILLRRWPLFGVFALLARGPVWADDAMDPERVPSATVKLTDQLRAKYCGVIATPELFSGVDPLDRGGLLPMVTAGCQARLDLSGTPADRLARQHGKWRNRLKRAQNTDLVVKHGPFVCDDDHWLLHRENEQSKARRYKRLPPEFTLAWAQQNGKKSTRLFTARHAGEIVAGMLFLVHGRAASYHIGWSGPAGRAMDAHNLLLWQAGEWFAQRGLEFIDLGTLDTETTAGLARFKLGSGALQVTLGTTRLDAPGARLVAKICRVDARSNGPLDPKGLGQPD